MVLRQPLGLDACGCNRGVIPPGQLPCHIAPVSWLVQRDVEEGREDLNYSEWDRAQDEAGESAKTVREGTMPPWYYVALHPSARLSASEKQALIRGLEATFGRSGRSNPIAPRGHVKSGT